MTLSLKRKKTTLAVIDITCQFCGKQCFRPLISLAPAHIIAACVTRRVNALATCESGQALDKAALGVCYADILAAVPIYEQIILLQYGPRRWRHTPLKEWGLIKWLRRLKGHK